MHIIDVTQASTLLKIPDTDGVDHSDIGNAEGDVQKSVSKDVKTVANDPESDSDQQFGFNNELVLGTPEISEGEQVDTDQNQHGNQETDVEECTIDGAGNSSHVDLDKDKDEVKEIQNDYEGDVGDENMIEQLFDAKTRPKVNSMVQFMVPDGEIKKARVLSSQPKWTGRSKDWLNVKLVGSDDPSSVDWSRIQWWRKIAQPAQIVLLSAANEYEQEVMAAKLKEMSNLEKNDVFQWVNNVGQKAVSTKWVITEKFNEDGSKRLKARLVARGFEEKLIGHKTDNSPTCSRQALRLAFVVVSTKSWKIHSLDITSAFLQGNVISRNVYVSPPKEFSEQGKLWQLK